MTRVMRGLVVVCERLSRFCHRHRTVSLTAITRLPYGSTVAPTDCALEKLVLGLGELSCYRREFTRESTAVSTIKGRSPAMPILD